MWVKSPLYYRAFVSEHGTVSQALRRADHMFEVPGGEPVECIGWVEQLGANDTLTDEEEYQRLALEIQAYNAAL